MVEENPAHDSQQNTSGNPKSDAPVPPVPAPIQPPKAITPAEQTSSQPSGDSGHSKVEDEIEADEKALSAFEKKMIPLTWAGLAVAAITGVFLYSQFKVMSDQTKILSDQSISAIAGAIETERNTREQLRIANEQAMAAQDGVKAIQRQMRQDQRAWMDIGFGPFQYELNKPASIAIVTKNVGKTPAMKYRCAVVVEILKIDQPPYLGTRQILPATTDSSGIMTPNAVMSFTAQTLQVNPADKTKYVSWDITETEKTALDTGKSYWVVKGMIWYDDIFKVSHWRKFCVFGPTNIVTPTRRCSEYNSADNN